MISAPRAKKNCEQDRALLESIPSGSRTGRQALGASLHPSNCIPVPMRKNSRRRRNYPSWNALSDDMKSFFLGAQRSR